MALTIAMPIGHDTHYNDTITILSAMKVYYYQCPVALLLV